MKLLKRLAFGLAGLCALLLLIGFLLPSNARVERSILIDRPASVIFPLLNSYQRFNQWSPWFALDPAAVYTYSGPQSGVGASMAWTGNEQVGTGKQTITLSEPDSRVETDLDFGEMGVAKASLVLTAEGEGTRLTWSFATELGNNPLNRYFGLMVDKFVGADYERGLAQLKTLAEKLPKVDIAGLTVDTVELSARPMLYVTASSTKDMQAISQAYGVAYQQILAQIEALGLKQAGAPLGIDNYWDERGYGFDAAIPVDRTDVALQAPVQAGTSYAGRALRLRHIGGYDGLVPALEQLRAYAQIHDLKTRDRVYSEFVSDPGSTAEAELITDLYLPVE